MSPPWIVSLVFFGTLGLIGVAQLFWYRRARRLVERVRPGWPRFLAGLALLGPLVLAWSVYLAGTLLFVLAELTGGARGVLVWLHVLRQPVVTIPVGLWSLTSAVSFLLIQLVKGVGWLGATLRPAPVNPGRRHLLQTGVYLAGAAPFALAGYGFLRRQIYRVEEVSVPIPNLPPELEGLRLVQLTDVHASSYMPVEEIRRVVGLASELDADLVFHTGDYITSRGDPLEPSIALLSQVRSRYGLFGCLGNHEIYAEATERATALFAARGVRILRQQNHELDIRGARLNLIGVDYQSQGRRPLAEAKPYFLRGVEKLIRPDAINLLLTHNPNPFLRAAELGIELTLAGHTHGGQVQVEILDSRLSPARFITPFISGLYQRPVPSDPSAALGTGPRPVASQEASATSSSASSLVASSRAPATAFLYVSRGIGTIATPIRLGAPPEITLLTLHRA